MRRTLSCLTATTTAAALLALLPGTATAGPLGAAETVVSGTTTDGGVGEAGVAALPDGRFLTVWEAVRPVTTGTAQGLKREIFGRYVAADGTPLGSPALLVRLGGADDATQDVAAPVAQVLSNGRVALAFAGDVKPDTVGAPTPVDETNWQVFAAIVDPAQPLGVLTPVQVTSVGHDAASPVLSDPAWDQQHPDLTEDHGQVRLVWQGDTPATGDGATDIWTVQRGLDLSGSTPPLRLMAGAGATRPRVASLTDGGSTPDSLIAFESVIGGERTTSFRRVLGSTLGVRSSFGVTPGTDLLTPDVTADASTYVIVASRVGAPASERRLVAARGAASPGSDTWSPLLLTLANQADTWPAVSPDLAQPGHFVLSWARRTSTAGTGHYEVVSGRLRPNASTLDEVLQISSVDGDMSQDNAESLRPALASAPGGALLNAWGRVRNNGGAGVAIRRTAARVDLSAELTVSPARPAPARAGLHAADEVTVTITYRNAVASVGSAPARITTTFPGFTRTGAATITPAAGPAPVESGTPGVFTVGRLAIGQGGTITLKGTMDAAAEGTVRTATGTIAPDGLVIEDPAPLNDTATAGVTIDHPLAVTAISRTSPTPTNAATVSWTVRFDQVPAGLDANDLALTTTGPLGATITGVACGVTTSCTVTASVTSGSLGTVGLRLLSTATATDPQGKGLATGNLPFVGEAYDVDRVAPTVTTTALGPDPTNAAQIDYRLDFSEPVTAPVAANLQVTGGTFVTATPTGGGSGPAASWTVGVAPGGDGSVSLEPLAGAASDVAGNPSVAGNEAGRTSDRTRPVMTLSGPATPTNAPYDVVVTASEPVTGLAQGDFTITGGTVDSLTGTGPWAVRVTPTTEGPVVLRLPADSVTDAATNTNLLAQSSTTYDITRPSVTVTSAAGSPTGANPIVFTLAFSEPVTGLTVDELTVSGGTATLTGSGATRTVSVVPAGDGVVTVGVPAGVALDAAGNTSTAGAPVSRTYDSTGPMPTISTTAASPTNAAVLPFRVSWSEPVTGFGPGDVAVDNGTISGWVLTGTVATFDVTPAAEGEVRVSVAA
ncbi:MAG: Ig-like domain-containing protein, partial [Nocardioides sp.]|nr:Ig-like domain-containing protein [Nocardioides sp.]